MKSRIPTALLSIPLLLALGCQPAEEGEEMAETGEGMEAESSMMATSALTLMALNESGVTGTANLSHTEETMTVSVELSGLTPGETYATHIHRGSCEAQGPVAAALGSVTAADDGTGSIETSVPMSELEPEEGAMEGHGEGMMEEGMEEGMKEGMEHAGFYIQAHLPDGTPAACADIKGPEGSMM